MRVNSKANQSDSSSGASDGPAGFEDCVREIEAIIERIDSGEIGLEKSLAEYERGVELLRRCRDVLKRVDQRVEELTEKALGGEPEAGAEPRRIDKSAPPMDNS